MKKFNVGIQLYGLRNTMKEDFEGTLRALADMGYEYVEFAGYYGKSSEELKAVLDKYGLKCISVHQGPDFFDADPDAAAEFLRGFGVKYSVIPYCPVENLAGSPDWESTLARFRRLADVLHAHGMMLGYHNHDFEFERYEGKYIHDYIVEGIPSDRFFPQLDTCWVHYAGIKPESKIYEFCGRVPVVHLKDFVCKNLGAGPVYDLIDNDGNPMKGGSRADAGFEFRPLGQGLQDFATILKACEECGTDTVIVEQDNVYDGMTELEAARISREYLRNTFSI
ncbi:MAG: sugar phosphate isomerase/epimerase [Clostridia bacterium]|nr:sugar phosphate isomerase/epimerase [Clostridia bacterium]